MTDTKWSEWIDWHATKDSVCPLEAGTVSQVENEYLDAKPDNRPESWNWSITPELAITAYRYEMTEERPAKWSGFGYPPVGSECFVLDVPPSYFRCQIVANRDGDLIYYVPETRSVGIRALGNFRPLPTKDEQQESKLRKLVRKAYAKGALGHNGGIDEIVSRLIAAGYRKADNE